MLRVELFQVAESATLADVNFEAMPLSVAEAGSLEFLPVAPDSDVVAQKISGQLDIEQSGAYTFDLQSDNPVELWINGELVASADGRATTAIVDLDSGQNSIEFRYMGVEEGNQPSIFWTGPDTEGNRADFLQQMSSSAATIADIQDIELARTLDDADIEASRSDVETVDEMAHEVLDNADSLVFHQQPADMLRSDGTVVHDGEEIALTLDWTELGDVQIHFDHDNDASTLAVAFDMFANMVDGSRSDFLFGQSSNGELIAMNERTNDVYVAVNTLSEEDRLDLQSSDLGGTSDDFLM